MTDSLTIRPTDRLSKKKKKKIKTIFLVQTLSGRFSIQNL